MWSCECYLVCTVISRTIRTRFANVCSTCSTSFYHVLVVSVRSKRWFRLLSMTSSDLQSLTIWFLPFVLGFNLRFLPSRHFLLLTTTNCSLLLHNLQTRISSLANLWNKQPPASLFPCTRPKTADHRPEQTSRRPHSSQEQ
jgi:hypothetical protein